MVRRARLTLAREFASKLSPQFTRPHLLTLHVRCCLPSRRRRGDTDVVLADLRPSPSSSEQDDSLEPYQYQPLNQEAQEIRLLKLLPAENHDDKIEIEIFHSTLIEPEKAPDTRLSFTELQKTVPKDWKMYKTLEDRYVFQNWHSGKTQWNHPNPEVDQEKYHCNAVLDPYPGFQPAYEGKFVVNTSFWERSRGYLWRYKVAERGFFSE